MVAISETWLWSFKGIERNISVFLFSPVLSKREMAPTKAAAACPYELPSKYKFLKVLGEGVFGTVLKCLDKETSETVAIKFPNCQGQQTWNEVRNFADFNVHIC